MTNLITDTDDAWDSKQLGADAEHVGVCSDEDEAAINAMLGTQAISIRLPKTLIQNFKMIAAFHGVGYQPLMRDILSRFAQAETAKIARELIEARQLEKDESLEESEQNALQVEINHQPPEKKCA